MSDMEKNVELNKGKVVIEKGFIQMAKELKTVQCPCGSKVYHPLVKPNIEKGHAELKLLVCMGCGHAVEISGDAIVGDKQKIYVDKDGKKHHRMVVEGGFFGPATDN